MLRSAAMTPAKTAMSERSRALIFTPGMGRVQTKEAQVDGDLVLGTARLANPRAIFHRMRGEPEVLLGGGFLRDRSKRILLPLVVGWPVVLGVPEAPGVAVVDGAGSRVGSMMTMYSITCSTLFQARLFQDAVQRARRQFVLHVAWDRYQARPVRMLVLAMTATGACEHPAIPPQQCQDVPYLHSMSSSGLRMRRSSVLLMWV